MGPAGGLSGPARAEIRVRAAPAVRRAAAERAARRVGCIGGLSEGQCKGEGGEAQGNVAGGVLRTKSTGVPGLVTRGTPEWGTPRGVGAYKVGAFSGRLSE